MTPLPALLPNPERLSEHDLGLALRLLDDHTAPAVARVIGINVECLRRNLASIGYAG